MGAMTENKLSGLALMAATVLSFLAIPFVPGAGFTNPDSLDFYTLTEAMTDDATLTLITSLLAVVLLLLYAFGFVGLWRNCGSGLGDVLVRWGLVAVFCYLFLILVAEGMDFITLHAVQHGVGRGSGGAEQAVLENIAVTLQSVKYGLRYAGGAAGPLGYFIMSLALVRGDTALSVHKIFPIIMLVATPVAFIAGGFAEYDHDLLEPIFPIAATLVILTFLYPFVLGWSLYRNPGAAVREGAPVS